MLNQSLYIIYIYYYIFVLGFWPCPQIGSSDHPSREISNLTLATETPRLHPHAVTSFAAKAALSMWKLLFDSQVTPQVPMNVERMWKGRWFFSYMLKRRVFFVSWIKLPEIMLIQFCVLLQAWPWHSAHSAHSAHGSISAPHPWRPGLPRHAPGWASSSGCQQCGCRRQLLRSLADGWCWLCGLMWAVGLQVACFSSLLEILGPITLRGYQYGNVIASTCFNQVCLNYLLQHWSLWWSLNLLDICFRP